MEEYSGNGGVLQAKDAKLLNALMQEIRAERGHIKTGEFHEEIIERCRPKRSPTHHLFEWDLATGHKLYLLERCRQLVMRVSVTFERSPPTRAWRGVVIEGVRGPAPIKQIISQAELMQAVLDEAKSALEAWARRYEHLKQVAELRHVFAAIETAKSVKPAKSAKKKATPSPKRGRASEEARV
jgi:hypothetical protein